MALYIDLLFLQNVVVNYGILLAAEKLSGLYTTIMRKFISAILGAIYLVLMILCPDLKTLYTLGGKLILSVLMVAAAFPFQTLKRGLKVLLSFYLSSVIFAGLGYALMSLLNQGIYYKNGVLYSSFRSDNLLLILTLLFGFLMVRSFTDLFRKRIEKESYIVNTTIHLGDRTVCLPALIDTGNTLIDPFTRYPVMVAELEGIKELLPAGLVEWLTDWAQSKEPLWFDDREPQWKNRIRLIPFHAIGTNNGMLPGFKPDSVSIEKEEMRFEQSQVVVCICQNRLSVKERYHAIISPEMISA